jgi:hypothetical protein
MLGTSDLPSLYGYIIDADGMNVTRVQSLSNGELIVAGDGRMIKLDADDYSEQWEVSGASSHDDDIGLAVDSNNFIYNVATYSPGVSSFVYITKHDPADGSQETYKREVSATGITFNHNAVYTTFAFKEGSDSAIVARTTTVDALYMGIDVEGGDTGVDDRTVEYNSGAGLLQDLVDRGDGYFSAAGRDSTSTNIFVGYSLANGTISSYKTVQYQIASVDKAGGVPSVVSDGTSRIYVSSLVDYNNDNYTALSKFDFNVTNHYQTIAYNLSGNGNRPIMVMDEDAEYIYLMIHSGSYKAYFIKIDLSDMSLVWEYSLRNTTSNFTLLCTHGCIKKDDGGVVWAFNNGPIIISPDGLPTGTFGDFEVVEESNGLKSDLTFDSLTSMSSTVASVTGSNADRAFDHWATSAVVDTVTKQELRL